jgi:hypothetical protein
MFAKWFEEYRRISVQMRFLSKLGTFTISLLSFLSCWSIFNALSYNPSALNALWNNIIISVIFHIIIGIVFGIRFALLFFNSKKAFWFAQLFWVFGLLSIVGFFIASRLKIYGSLFRPSSDIDFGTHNYPVFLLYAGYSFGFFVFIYFFLSPIHQIITSIIAFKKSK